MYLEKYRESDRKIFGNLIKRQRKTLGLTLEKLAELTDLSREWISKVERGKSTIHYIDAFRIVLAFEFVGEQELITFIKEAVANVYTHIN